MQHRDSIRHGPHLPLTFNEPIPFAPDACTPRCAQIHERGKRFEVAWHGVNNRGEEVDTNVERRIDLPVTYSLAGAAADAIAAASNDSASAALARKGVLAEARIGSWCIQYPQEPWGMLDPFGEDSSLSS